MLMNSTYMRNVQTYTNSTHSHDRKGITNRSTQKGVVIENLTCDHFVYDVARNKVYSGAASSCKLNCTSTNCCSYAVIHANPYSRKNKLIQKRIKDAMSTVTNAKLLSTDNLRMRKLMSVDQIVDAACDCAMELIVKNFKTPSFINYNDVAQKNVNSFSDKTYFVDCAGQTLSKLEMDLCSNVGVNVGCPVKTSYVQTDITTSPFVQSIVRGSLNISSATVSQITIGKPDSCNKKVSVTTRSLKNGHEDCVSSLPEVTTMTTPTMSYTKCASKPKMSVAYSVPCYPIPCSSMYLQRKSKVNPSASNMSESKLEIITEEDFVESPTHYSKMINSKIGEEIGSRHTKIDMNDVELRTSQCSRSYHSTEPPSMQTVSISEVQRSRRDSRNSNRTWWHRRVCQLHGDTCSNLSGTSSNMSTYSCIHDSDFGHFEHNHHKHNAKVDRLVERIAEYNSKKRGQEKRIQQQIQQQSQSEQHHHYHHQHHHHHKHVDHKKITQNSRHTKHSHPRMLLNPNAEPYLPTTTINQHLLQLHNQNPTCSHTHNHLMQEIQPTINLHKGSLNTNCSMRSEYPNCSYTPNPIQPRITKT